MKVYIQQVNGNYADDWSFAAYIGFNKLGAEIINFEEIEEVPLRKDIVVVAFVEDTLKYLQYLNLEIPKPLNIPKSLELYSNRTFIPSIKFSDFKKDNIFDNKFFIKPANKTKEFMSGVVSTMKTLEGVVNDDSIVFVSEIIDIESEWRVFVHDKKIIGVQNYAGNPFLIPDEFVVNQMITKFDNQPIAYTLDIGVNKIDHQLQSFIIECNDGWSIGNYGLEGKAYAKMLRDRWFEMMKTLPNLK